MHDGRGWRLGQWCAEPLLDVFHHGQRPRVPNRPLELIDPALELPLKVAVGTPEALEADSAPIDRLKRHQQIDHRLTYSTAMRRRRDRGGPAVGTNHFAAHVLHEKERRADKTAVVARRVHARDRNGACLQRLEHTIFANDVVCGRQQRAPWRTPERPRLAVEMDQVKLVRMAERDVLGAQIICRAELAIADETWKAADIDRGRRPGLVVPSLFAIVIHLDVPLWSCDDANAGTPSPQ